MKTIVFTFPISDIESYSYYAHFILKREKHMLLDMKEVRDIKYKYYFTDENKQNKDWVKRIDADDHSFKKIQEPHNIKEITDEYQVIYCAILDSNADIVQLQNLYLLKKYYSNIKFLMICKNWENEFFYKVSQYLYSVNSIEIDFHNSFFFVKNGKCKRCQMKNVTFSKKFIPLQIVDEENIQRLYRKCNQVLSEEDFKIIFSDVKTGEITQDSDVLEGAKKILYTCRNKFAHINTVRLYELISETDVFAFVLFCYAISNQQSKLNYTIIEKYLLQIRQYGNAIKQLCENIIFHSDSKYGCISVRIHDSEKNYFSNVYGTESENLKEQYMEILISDFNAENKSGNIADNFIASIDLKGQKRCFENMMPISFFNQQVDSQSKKEWREFYSNPDNIGKHFGLKIFQSIVRNYAGFFVAESHTDYASQKGEVYCSFDKETSTHLCLPGTRYSIVLPLDTMNQIMVQQDQSLDSGINISENISTILSYTSSTISHDWVRDKYVSQKEKNALIILNSKMIAEKLEKENSDVIYVSMKQIEDEEGEIYIKALIMALYRIQTDFNLVLYDCSDGLKKNLFETLRIFMCDTDLCGMFFDKSCQIVLYSQRYEETVIVPSSIRHTNDINAYIEHMKCMILTEWYMHLDEWQADLNEGAKLYIPYDVLGDVEVNGKKGTLFEHYTYEILNESIQSEMFGCKIDHTHMRLGSTIHIDKFYEAELLFDNKLFVSRFALLLVKEMKEDVKDISELTLYGYGTYSETVLVQAIDMLQNLYPDKKDIDYIILEREEERRGFLHKDRIRYNRSFVSDEERIEYFKNRKVAVIVLINSTLKTHVRLISMFKDENRMSERDEDWILRNYAVLLVGEKSNTYWNLNKNKISMKKEMINPIPYYFIQTDVSYYEPLDCKLCFPNNPIAEIPLIEVNAASTIPNQAFGIKEEIDKVKKINYEDIRNEEKEIGKLKDCLVYGHIQRNENHFLYYFKTENLWVEERNNIQHSLHEWKEKWENDQKGQYNIIVAPMHFSNAGFVELVNNQVFSGNAILMRIDFDKEYRSNAYAKFSYLRNYIKQMNSMKRNAIVRVHYVDDCIISGRTYHRAKSLIESVLGIYGEGERQIEIRVFDKIFVLVDRNSKSSRMQYIQNWNQSSPENVLDEYFYSFVNVDISSLRNYGDSCVFCNLGKEAELLHKTASTAQVSKYWKDYICKFSLNTLEEYAENQERKEREFRRLFCAHMAQKVLDEASFGNSTENALYLILDLLNMDYANREMNQFEYFLSYLKCISRPFLVFKKPVKEAIFDILLIIIDALVRDVTIAQVLQGVKKEKLYLVNRKVVMQFNKLDKQILKAEERSFQDKIDLVRLVMKQLTELKSNYIIRPEKMNEIFAFVENMVDMNEFQTFYMALIKRLVGVTSDTTKSAWLDNVLLIEMSKLNSVPVDFKNMIILENTRAFRDGIEKLYIKRNASKEFRKCLKLQIDNITEEHNKKRALKLLAEFISMNKDELEKYDKIWSEDAEYDTYIGKKIKNMVNQLPVLSEFSWSTVLNDLKQPDESWHLTLNKLIKNAKEWTENTDLENNIAFQGMINDEINIYQYNSFKSILKHCDYIEDSRINQRGMDMITACLDVLTICRDKNSKYNLKDQVQQLAILFNIILKADKVQFVIEKKNETYYEEWQQVVEHEFNENIVAIYNERNGSCLEGVKLIKNKQYAVIAESSDEAYTSVLNNNIVLLLSEKQTAEVGYYFVSKNGIVLWKIGDDTKPLWVVVSNHEWINETDEKVAYAMRRIMVFYQELRERIFNSENEDYLNELYQMTKELSIFHSKKAHLHTKEDIESMHYKQVLKSFSDDNEYNECYPSYMLNLLADVNVSREYRDSLKKEFYADDYTFGKTAQWKDFELLNNNEYIYKMEGGEKICIKLKVTDIDSKELVLCKPTPSSIRELGLLLYSIILNAAEDKRGIREKIEMQNGKKYVIVMLRKESGRLVISNKNSNAVIDIVQLQDDLKRVPESEKDGISMWSISRYIKKCISTFIMAKLKDTRKMLDNNVLTDNYIQSMRERIQELLSDEYEVQFYKRSDGEYNYFEIGLPIFMERYKWDICD